MIDLAAPMRDWLPCIWYGGYTPALPDLCVGRLPEPFRRVHPDPCKIWIVEIPAERQALLDALARPVPRAGNAINFSAGPDRATPTSRARGQFLALYLPPSEGWPWVVIVAVDGAPAAMSLNRGRYAYETFQFEAAALAHMARLRAMVPNAPLHTPADVVKS